MEHTSEKEKDSAIESLFDRAKDYVETRSELIKLKAVRKGSEVASELISTIIVTIIFGCFLMLLNIGVGLWLGAMLNNLYLGFFALAGFYLLIGMIIYANKKKFLKMPLANSIIKKIND